MGRTSKFSFPLMGRKRRQSPAYVAQAPPDVPLSKAERILGATGLSVPGGLTNRSISQRSSDSSNQLSIDSKPSYRSLRQTNSPYDSSTNDISSGMQDVLASEDYSSSQPQPSQDQYDHETESTPETSPQLLHRPSNPTFRDYQDSYKSASDRAQDWPPAAYLDPSRWSGDKAGVETEDLGLLTSDSQLPKAHDSAIGSPVIGNPNRWDPSRLYPRPGFPGSRDATPRNLSASNLTAHDSEYPTRSTSIHYHHNLSSNSISNDQSSRNSAVRKVESVPSFLSRSKTTRTVTTAFREREKNEFDLIKEHIRRPPQGAKDWFDCLPELDDDDDLDEDDYYEDEDAPEVEGLHDSVYDTSYEEPYNTSFEPSYGAPFDQVPSVPTVSRYDRQIETYVPTRGGKTDHTDVEPLVSPLDEHFSQSHDDDAERPSSRGVVSLISHRTGVSSLTKASKDDVPDVPTRPVHIMPVGPSENSYIEEDDLLRPPRIRDSIAISDIEENVQIVKAETMEVRVRTKPSRKDTDSRSSISSSVFSGQTSSSLRSVRSSVTSPAYLTVPAQYKKKLAARAKKQSSIPESSPDLQSSSKSEASSKSEGSQSPRSSAQSSQQSEEALPENHKLMAVTPEEEALLEMMRRKRKAMTKHTVPQGLDATIRHEIQRPSTSNGVTMHQPRSMSRGGRRAAPARLGLLQPSSSSALLLSFPSPPPTASLPNAPWTANPLLGAQRAPLLNVRHMTQRLSQHTMASSGSIESRLSPSYVGRVNKSSFAANRAQTRKPPPLPLNIANADTLVRPKTAMDFTGHRQSIPETPHSAPPVAHFPIKVGNGSRSSSSSSNTEPINSPGTSILDSAKSLSPEKRALPELLPTSTVSELCGPCCNGPVSPLEFHELEPSEKEPLFRDDRSSYVEISPPPTAGLLQPSNTIKHNVLVIPDRRAASNPLASAKAQLHSLQPGSARLACLSPRFATIDGALSPALSPRFGGRRASLASLVPPKTPMTPMTPCGHTVCAQLLLHRRSSLPVTVPETRCSVTDDVLMAWGELGGWRGSVAV